MFNEEQTKIVSFMCLKFKELKQIPKEKENYFLMMIKFNFRTCEIFNLHVDPPNHPKCPIDKYERFPLCCKFSYINY